ncbi:MAG: hypothetical protein WCT04_02830 [Planctomycetota bacterium]
MTLPETDSDAPSDRRFAPARSTAVTLALGLLAALIAGAAAATQAPEMGLAVAGLVACACGMFLLRHRSILLLLLVFTAPFSDKLGVNVGGLNVRPYVGLTALGVLWIVWLAFTRGPSRTREIVWHYKGLMTLVILLMASKIATVSTLSVLPPHMASIFCIKIILFIGLQFAASFVVAGLIETPARLHQIIRGWIHITNIVCFVAFLQLVAANALGMERYVWHRDIIAIGRPYSVFREPDVLGCFYASSIVMLVPLVVIKVDFVSRPYLILSLLAQTFFLMLSVVRAGWVASVCCMAVYVIAMMAKRRFNNLMPYLNGVLAAGVLGLVGLCMAAPSVAEKVIDRFASVSNPKAESGAAYRLMEMKHQFDMVIHPRLLTGGPMTVFMGYGDFSWSYWARYIIPEEDYDQSAKSLKRGEVLVQPGFCMPLSIQFDNGLIGFALYSAFALVLTANFLKTLSRTNDPGRQALLLSTFLPVVAVLVCYVFSYDPLFLVLWILIGIHLAAAYHVHRIESGVDEIGIPEPA